MSVLAIETLTAARELLSSPTRWCQRSFALNAVGDQVSESAPSAASWCLVGAILRCGETIPVRKAVRKAAGLDYGSLVGFNDQATHEQVLAFLDNKIASLAGEVAPRETRELELA